MPDGLPRVPVEFIGLARVFRSEVQHVDKTMDEAALTIIRPLLMRLTRRHVTLRPEMISDAVKSYRERVPMAFRLGEVVVNPHRSKFSISETRVTSSVIRNTSWDSEAVEQGTALARCTLALEKGRLAVHWVPVAIVSLHALARWFERSGLRDHAALLTALAVLADAAEDGDEVETPDGGRWLGGIEPMRGTDRQTAHARNIRTWLP